MAYKKIKTLSQIRESSTNPVYVRWSQSIAKDIKRGYSLAYGATRETGLSCCKIETYWDDWRILRQLMEYQFCGGYCWLITGDEAGAGQDNEPLLRNVKAVGKIQGNLLKTDWRKMELDDDIDRLEEALSSGRMTDKIAIQIFEKDSAKAKKTRLEKYGL